MNILIWIITGLIAAYLAGLIIKGCGLGLLRNIDVGLIGGLLRGWFFNLVGVSVPGWPGQVLVAAVYAFILVFYCPPVTQGINSCVNKLC